MSQPVDPLRIPAPLVALCRKLQQRGVQAYIVGGAVRDLLLGRAVNDWDVATSARPQQVQQTFAKTIPTGIQHGTVTVLLGKDLAVEVTTYRGESTYSDGRHPDSVTFVSSLGEDLSRRDFTINAMAYDPVGRALEDPLGGQGDLARRVVRAVGDPAARFGEDGLRALRAVRFAATLQFCLDEATLAAIPGALDRFRLVSWERVRDELLKLLAAPQPSLGLELMRRSGLLAEALPEVAACSGVSQNRHHQADVYQHSLEVCDRCPPDPLLRLAGLLHDVGKPLVAQPDPEHPGEQLFHGHQAAGAERCQSIVARLKLSGEQQRRVCLLVREHMFPLQGVSDAGLRRLIRRVGREQLADLFALRAADIAAKPGAEGESAGQRQQLLAAQRQRLDALLAAPLALGPGDLAISGGDVMARLQLRPGPRVGQIIKELVERVIEEPQLNERECLLALVDEVGEGELS